MSKWPQLGKLDLWASSGSCFSRSIGEKWFFLPSVEIKCGVVCALDATASGDGACEKGSQWEEWRGRVMTCELVIVLTNLGVQDYLVRSLKMTMFF